MIILLSTGSGLLAILCIWLGVRLCKVRRDTSMDFRLAELVFKNVDAFILLINKDFEVQKTNLHLSLGKPVKVGNVLRCKNGTDAGICGTHELCATCPIRQAINEGFSTHTNFEKLEAPIILYTSDDKSSAIACKVSVTGSYFESPEGEYMLLTVHDITYLKNIQQELNEARDHAEESDRMKSLFLANTSHELRTPLNAIVGFSELLAGDPDSEEKQEYVQIIRSNNELLLQLVNDILDLSKIEAGTLEFEFTDIDLNAIMEELEGVYRRKLPNNRMSVEFDRKYPQCRAYADQERFTQIMSNFLSNAMKFTSEGKIIFGYETRTDEYYFYVKDTGVGIPKEELEHVFHRFVKIGSHKQGVGIGLAICRSIVDSVGGKIGVESQVGNGSTFWFSIPKEKMQ